MSKAQMRVLFTLGVWILKGACLALGAVAVWRLFNALGKV